MATSGRHRFDGQVVLITGASSGIGASLAREFAREGARTVLVARRVERIEALAAELTTGSRRSGAVAGDVTRDGDLERAVDLARREFGRLDVAVANAGILAGGRILDLTLDDYRKHLETNTFGALRTVMAALPALQETRGRTTGPAGDARPHRADRKPARDGFRSRRHAILREQVRLEWSFRRPLPRTGALRDQRDARHARIRQDGDLQQHTCAAAAAQMDRVDRANSGSSCPADRVCRLSAQALPHYAVAH